MQFFTHSITQNDSAFLGDNIWLLLGDESSLRGFKNSRSDAFPAENSNKTLNYSVPLGMESISP